MLGVQVLTLSRSGALGDVVGLLMLLPVIRGFLPSARSLAIGFGSVAAVFAIAYESSYFLRRVVQTRISTGGSGTQTHFQFYQLVGPALDPHPLFGMGFNTFAVFYQFITGRSDFGPHSIWIAVLVETGIVGLGLYLGYFAYLVVSAAAVRRSPDLDVARLGYGMTAALIGTAAANFFYLTMSFDYFFALALLAVGGAVMFAPARTAQSPLVAAAATGVRRT
jgi:O-Antigen ligase